jgi:non-specific serine/threonine protein kinase
VAFFTDEDIKKYSFAAVIEDGRKCFAKGRVSNLHFIGNDILATVKADGVYKIVISRNNNDVQFNCTCGFALGGACEHVVASMIAANENQAIQVGINWDAIPEDTPVESENPSEKQLTRDKNYADEPSSSEDSELDESGIDVKEVAGEKPTGRLYLSESDSMLFVELRFAYFSGLVEFSRTDGLAKIISENGIFYKVQRSKAREVSLSSSMVLYELMHYQTGFFTPTCDPRIWILQELPRLADLGFEIYGQEKLKTTNARKASPKLSVAVKSEGGVFDCELTVSFDGISATLASLIMAVRQGSRFVLLSDGSSGVIPQTWLEKFASIFAILETDESGKKLRLQSANLSLSQILFDMADTWTADGNFREKQQMFKDFKGVETCSLPVGLNASLRPYQAAGYEWFYFLKKYGFGGCLADDMGLGKTLQTIALLLKEKELGEGQTSIVILPTSLLVNWQREIQKFAPSLQTLIYHGAGRARYVDIMNMADVVLTTYGTIIRDLEIIKNKRFHYVILDEAQAIKNPASQISRALRQVKGMYRLAISGTPIENNLSEVWSLFTFINPGILGTFAHFSQNFIKPIEKEMNESSAEVLRKLLFPYILRRTKQQVAKDLPPKNEMVMYVDMLERQKMMYEITRETYKGKIIHSFENEPVESTRFQILEGMLRLRQICSHPRLVDPSFSGDSGKFQMVDQYIFDIVSEGHRVLVFSQFVKVLEMMRERIALKGIVSEMLTGSTRDRQAVVDRFQSDKGAPVFFISLKAGGTGLNLTAADYVIHLDPWWNPSAENQASDRAYRIGQTKPVFVYKIITKDSIEERVLMMQERKKQLMQSIIHTENSFFKKLTRDDVMTFFS